MNWPYVPRMSGVPIPASSRVAVPVGGKSAGIRMIVVSMPFASSGSQKGVPCRRDSTRAADKGSRQLPSRTVCAGGSDRVVERYGAIVFGSRWMKSKMPCAPGSRPVMNVDQATGLWGGIVVASRLNVPPDATTREKFGMRPAAIRSRASA